MAFYNTHIPSTTKKEACETEVKKNVPTTRRKSIALGLLGLLLCLPVVDSRPSERRQGRAMEAVGEFLYRERIEQPCRIMTPPRSVGRPEVAGAVERATAALARATDTLGEQDCRDLHLTSILGTSTNFTGLSRYEPGSPVPLYRVPPGVSRRPPCTSPPPPCRPTSSSSGWTGPPAPASPVAAHSTPSMSPGIIRSWPSTGRACPAC